MEVRTASAEETQNLARLLADTLEPGMIIALDGDLGAGKTTFVQGLAEGLGAAESVSSPTFVLLRIYHGRLSIFHFDAYRLDSSAQLEDIGADEYLWGGGISVVEWAERVADALPADRLRVRMTHDGHDARRICFEATGPRHAAILQSFTERTTRLRAGSS